MTCLRRIGRQLRCRGAGAKRSEQAIASFKDSEPLGGPPTSGYACLAARRNAVDDIFAAVVNGDAEQCHGTASSSCIVSCGGSWRGGLRDHRPGLIEPAHFTSGGVVDNAIDGIWRNR